MAAASYDADEILARMRADEESDWPSRLLDTLVRRADVVGMPLSHRQREVLALYSLGFSDTQAARELELDIETVKTHRTKLYRKLGVNRRVLAVAKAIRLGIID